MKITKQQLRKIIKEELKEVYSPKETLNEGAWLPNDLDEQTSLLVDETLKKLADPRDSFAFAVAILERAGAESQASEVNMVLRRRPS